MNANKSVIDHMIEKINDEQMESVSGGGDKPETTKAAMPQDPNYWCTTCQDITFHYGRKCSKCGK